jgi:hypothetical protein
MAVIHYHPDKPTELYIDELGGAPPTLTAIPFGSKRSQRPSPHPR